MVDRLGGQDGVRRHFGQTEMAHIAGLDEAKAISLMTAQPSMIKRPVLEGAGQLLVGFKPEAYAARFGG